MIQGEMHLGRSLCSIDNHMMVEIFPTNLCQRLKEVSVRNVKMCVMDGFGKKTWRVGICVLKGVSKIEF